MTQKAKRRLSDFNFERDGSHVALVHKDQGGPANLHTTLILKSTENITDQQVASQLALIEKAKFNSQVRNELETALKNKFQDDDEWLYLEDFDESRVIFSKPYSLYVANYSITDDEEYVVADTATSVEKEWFFVETGKVIFSEDVKDKMEEGVYVLVNKALNNPETNSRVVKALTDFTEKKEKMQEEIQKAVAAKDQEIQALQKQVEDLSEIVKAAEVAKKETLLKAREAAAQVFLKDGAVELVKATADLSDEAFSTILKGYEIQKAAVEASDLMKQVSDPNAEQAPQESLTSQILKAKYGQKQ